VILSFMAGANFAVPFRQAPTARDADTRFTTVRSSDVVRACASEARR
jgi:hypothetical protein